MSRLTANVTILSYFVLLRDDSCNSNTPRRYNPSSFLLARSLTRYHVLQNTPATYEQSNLQFSFHRFPSAADGPALTSVSWNLVVDSWRILRVDVNYKENFQMESLLPSSLPLLSPSLPPLILFLTFFCLFSPFSFYLFRAIVPLFSCPIDSLGLLLFLSSRSSL